MHLAPTRRPGTYPQRLAQDIDKQLTVILASALYMPLMHEESLVSLIAARCLFAELKPRGVTAEEHSWVDIGVAASKRHIQQLERFGKFPTILGRVNTSAEDEFLKEHITSL
jgi:uncharacterized protein (DUF924 family)